MNAKEKNQAIMRCLNMLDLPSRAHRNCIRHDYKAGVKHREKVNEIADELEDDGHVYVCRARLLDYSGVVDVFDLCCSTVIEVQDSEKLESIERKKKLYEEKGLKFMRININA